MTEQPPPDEASKESTKSAVSLSDQKNIFRDSLGMYYIGLLIVAMGGLAITHSSIFPLGMFLATLVYLGAQIAFRFRDVRGVNQIFDLRAVRLRDTTVILA